MDGPADPLVYVPQPAFADHLHLAVDEIVHWAADVDRVLLRVGVMLADLRDAAIPPHAATVAAACESFAARRPMHVPVDPAYPADTGLR